MSETPPAAGPSQPGAPGPPGPGAPSLRSRLGRLVSRAPAPPGDDQPDDVGGPVRSAWREGTLTRAQELENLAGWARHRTTEPNADLLLAAIRLHLTAARQ